MMKAKHTLDGLEFEWDSQKAEANLAKHGVSFHEACEVFQDPFVRTVDEREINGEPREAVLGLTRKWKLLYVAFLWRTAIRILSARKATKRERKMYEDQ